ncbi:MarR family winged helix-turn-helix transcriptional regulator [Scatolibacter rhodanostii]|uniref:MarR family winged helix-turn-helix transcriptional regulator n=1 Tax=Scatolibacter rhodanostii TaxID=2014781 RepID=UPI0013565DF3|nr:MarR family transcriptional regulator [Scatolibacter rhodanostii]
MKEDIDKERQNCRLDGCLFFSITKLAREFSKLAENAFSKTGLSPSHAVLLYIINLKGSMQQKDVGELLHLTPSTITRLIDKLERKGYVAKQLEGKNVCLLSTEKGQSQQDLIIDAWNLLHKDYQDILTQEEMMQFLEMSGKLLEALTNKSE